MAMKTEARHTLRIPRFYIIYTAVTVAVIITVIALLGVLSNRLSEYESAQPKYVVSSVFGKYFAPINDSGNYSTLLSADRDTVRYDAGLAGMTEIVEFLRGEVGENELTYSKGSSASPDELRYIVRAGAKQIAAITLIPGDATEHGFKTYKFSYIELFIKTKTPEQPPETTPPTPTIVVNIDAPSSYTVTVDGVKLTAENIASSHVRNDLFRYYPQGIEGIDCTVYTLTTLTELPKEVVVTDANGGQAEVTFDEETNTFTAGIIYSAALSGDHAENVLDAIERFAAYIQRAPEVSLGSFKKYFDESSTAYADVEAMAADRWMMKAPAGYEFEDASCGEFYAFSPTVISCHVSFRLILHRDGSEDYTDVIDKYVFLHDTGDGYKIYEWYNA